MALPQITEAEQKQIAEHLAQAIRIATVSPEGGLASPETLAALQAHLQTSFPSLHQTLQHEVVNDHGLIYIWPGQDASRKPYLLMAHKDVVPIEPGSETRWQHPPFSGAIDGGFDFSGYGCVA